MRTEININLDPSSSGTVLFSNVIRIANSYEQLVQFLSNKLNNFQSSPRPIRLPRVANKIAAIDPAKALFSSYADDTKPSIDIGESNSKQLVMTSSNTTQQRIFHCNFLTNNGKLGPPRIVHKEQGLSDFIEVDAVCSKTDMVAAPSIDKDERILLAILYGSGSTGRYSYIIYNTKENELNCTVTSYAEILTFGFDVWLPLPTVALELGKSLYLSRYLRGSCFIDAAAAAAGAAPAGAAPAAAAGAAVGGAVGHAPAPVAAIGVALGRASRGGVAPAAAPASAGGAAGGAVGRAGAAASSGASGGRRGKTKKKVDDSEDTDTDADNDENDDDDDNDDNDDDEEAEEKKRGSKRARRGKKIFSIEDPPKSAVRSAAQIATNKKLKELADEVIVKQVKLDAANEKLDAANDQINDKEYQRKEIQRSLNKANNELISKEKKIEKLESSQVEFEEQLRIKDAALAEAEAEAEAAKKNKSNIDAAVVVDKNSAIVQHHHFHGNVGMVVSNSNGLNFGGFGGINFNK